VSITEVFSFILASIILAFSPGPDNLFVVVTSLSQGFKTAFRFILGLCSGVILHTALIALGISTLVSQSTYGLLVLKYFAIIYLLYLAFKTFQHRKDKIQFDEQIPVENYFLRGFIMNVSNPKVLMFFLAFFPQFADMGREGFQARIILLGFLFILVTLVVFSTMAWFSAKWSKKFLANSKYTLFINWLAIIVFIGVSLLLFLS
jgi:threonine/homoserine/homoserine lactone efflux protein